jgi:hypothetical protein
MNPAQPTGPSFSYITGHVPCTLLQAWYAQCEAVREQRRATGAAFTHAFLVTHAHLTLWSAWSAWRRWVTL